MHRVPRAGFSVTVLPLLVGLVGCAAAPAAGTRDPAVITIMTGGGDSYQIRRGTDVRVNPTVTATPAEAWTVLPEVYRGLGFEPDVQDSGARTLGVSAHRISRRLLNRAASDFFECGLDPGLNRPLADQGPITAHVVTQVVASGAGAELRTVVSGTARPTGGNAGLAHCRSTGLLETLIGDMVQKAVRPGA